MSINKISSVDKPIAEFIFAHGAGAGIDSEFMQDMALLLSERHILVSAFNFDYMQTMTETGKRRPPDRMPKLQACFETKIANRQTDLPLFIGGKSMGGRVASLVLQQSTAIGGIALGYPFHPSAKPEKLRTEHLYPLLKPLLVIQGEKDTFGRQQEVLDYGLPDNIQCHFLEAADHSFKPTKRSGYTQQQHLISAADIIQQFIQRQL
ncbi:alpha/beta hydrolase [Alteromonadaceae bacterium BrNp21-10]|nr:alpha/beta hydrolase [Alteromonadaceae bacterium BrNp21-10]